jgi:hypothetical protein
MDAEQDSMLVRRACGWIGIPKGQAKDCTLDQFKRACSDACGFYGWAAGGRSSSIGQVSIYVHFRVGKVAESLGKTGCKLACLSQPCRSCK